MKISTRGRYAVRLMIDVAENEKSGNVTMKDAAKRLNISLKYLEQIVNLLGKAGYLKSRRGSQGGYQLTREPSEYSVEEILRVTEGDLAPVACLEGGLNTCPMAAECPTVKLWEGLDKVISDYLGSVTIADLVRNRGGIDYYI